MKRDKLIDLEVQSFIILLDLKDRATFAGADSGGASAVCPDYTYNDVLCAKTYNRNDCTAQPNPNIKYQDIENVWLY